MTTLFHVNVEKSKKRPADLPPESQALAVLKARLPPEAIALAVAEWPGIMICHKGRAFGLQMKQPGIPLTLAQTNAVIAMRGAGMRVCSKFSRNFGANSASGCVNGICLIARRLKPTNLSLGSRRSLAFACPLDMLMPSAPQAHALAPLRDARPGMTPRVLRWTRLAGDDTESFALAAYWNRVRQSFGACAQYKEAATPKLNAAGKAGLAGVCSE
jgi:hypothetical protein